MKPHHAKRKANKQKFKNKPQTSPKTAAAKPAAADNVTNSPALQAAIKAADAHKAAAGKSAPSPKQAHATASKNKNKHKQATKAQAAKTQAKVQTAKPKKQAAADRHKKPPTRTTLPEKQTAAPKDTTAALRQERSLAWKLSATFALSALACVWLAQNSINAYWQQTYHRDSPLAALNGSGLWQAGGKLYAAAEQAYRQWPPSAAATAPLAQAPAAQAAASAASGLPENDGTDSNVHSASAPEVPATPANVVLNSGDTVLFAGDSMMEGVAPHLQRRLKSEYRINSLNLSRQSTGLAYPSLFDWPATIEQTLAQNPDIKLVVVFLGPNDPWDFPNPAGGRAYLRFQSEEWEAEYRSRISRIANAADRAGARLIWVGIPLMKSGKLNRQMRYLDSLYADELKHRAIWLPTDTLLGDGSGEYRDTIAIDGKNQRIRSKDGIHFTLTGQKYVAEAIARQLTLPPTENTAQSAPAAAGS
ncbi:hypothetical protein L1281_001880 [Neisseria sp. HSC-16F19]|nr:SGNH family hydrolase [Neisseria sp. HSC-16F19]MCP2041282.1 hypothetical protein [Neisseria sp. HSC-16F19]